MKAFLPAVARGGRGEWGGDEDDDDDGDDEDGPLNLGISSYNSLLMEAPGAIGMTDSLPSSTRERLEAPPPPPPSPRLPRRDDPVPTPSAASFA